jgi:hypothetical protein
MDLPGGEEAGADDTLLAAVRAAAAPDFEVLGEIARRESDGAVVFLARAAADQGLVALRVTPEPGGQEFQLELARKLEPGLPSPGGTCARCGAQFLAWARFCSKCGSGIFGSAEDDESPHAREELRAAVEEAAHGRYEILGEMRHAEGVGVVYFARDLASGHIEALRVQPEGEQEYSIGKTNVMRRVSVSIQTTRAPAPPTPPAPSTSSARPAPAVTPPARRPGVAPHTRPPAAARPPAPMIPPHSVPSQRRRSLHIPLPDIRVPELSPVAWVAIGFVVLIVLIIVIFS